jgi:hypothetical protein
LCGADHSRSGGERNKPRVIYRQKGSAPRTQHKARRAPNTLAGVHFGFANGAGIGDPRSLHGGGSAAAGLLRDIARPEGNVTGITSVFQSMSEVTEALPVPFPVPNHCRTIGVLHLEPMV